MAFLIVLIMPSIRQVQIWGAIRGLEQRTPVDKGAGDKEQDGGTHQQFREKETLKPGRIFQKWQTQHLGIS
jgi:hypothetical protein